MCWWSSEVLKQCSSVHRWMQMVHEAILSASINSFKCVSYTRKYTLLRMPLDYHNYALKWRFPGRLLLCKDWVNQAELFPVSFRTAMKFSIWTKQREKYVTGKNYEVLASLLSWSGIEKVKSEMKQWGRDNKDPLRNGRRRWKLIVAVRICLYSSTNSTGN